MPGPDADELPGRAATRRLVWLLAALAVATIFAIIFVDRPVAHFMSGHQRLRRLFQACAAPSLLTLPLSGLYLAYAAYQRTRGKLAIYPGSHHGSARLWIAASIATLAGTAAKDELKFIFGRPWPGTWLRFGDYRFHPFVNSVFYGAFPSGHTSYIAAPLCVVWALAPRLRPLCGVIIGMVMAGLIAANYHFVSDTLAGLMTGILCAWGSVILTRPEPVMRTRLPDSPAR